MVVHAASSPASRIAALLCGVAATAALPAAPAQAARAPQARLVHCGTDTCLRLSGVRSHAAVAVRIGGRDLAVEGGRAWRVAVPLSTARGWPISPGYSLIVTMADAQRGTERREAVMLPPGALGSRVELATLVVRAR